MIPTCHASSLAAAAHIYRVDTITCARNTKQHYKATEDEKNNTVEPLWIDEENSMYSTVPRR